MAKKIPETFRCHITVKGQQCPCDLTMANTFTYTLTTLDQKAAREGVTVDARFLATQAICPWHGRLLARIRRDVVRMDNVVNLLTRRERQARHARVAREEVNARNAFLRQRVISRQPRLGAALIAAGVCSI